MINEILQCDFCSMPGPVWRYPARSFIAYCAPNVAGASVAAKVRGHGRHDKVRIVKFRRRKHHRKQMGHRQHYTEIEITAIAGGNKGKGEE